jgi:hypothetical protein
MTEGDDLALDFPDRRNTAATAAILSKLPDNNASYIHLTSASSGRPRANDPTGH